MNNWFYAHHGEQKGPVSEEELIRLAARGEFLPAKDLVWREGMSDWKKVAEVPELNLAGTPSSGSAIDSSAPVTRSVTSQDPYQAPTASPYLSNPTEVDDPPEIEPGSLPLQIADCISRGFDLTKRYFGIVLAVWAIYFGISLALGFVFSTINALVGGMSSAGSGSYGSAPPQTIGAIGIQLVMQLISQLISIYFTMGLARFGLNLISGKPAGIELIFGQGSKLVRGCFASLLVGLIVAFFPVVLGLVGMALQQGAPAVVAGVALGFIPSIYLGLRYGQFLNAMVDRDLGIMESLQYSATITQNNKWALLGLSVLLILIQIAGALALCVGLIFTTPLVWLINLVAYRWLRHGHAVLQDRGLLRNQFSQ